MKVAIVHDYLNQYGGAERVLELFMDLFPDAPIYTLLTDLSKVSPRFREADIRTSFIHNIPLAKKHYKKMIGLFPLAVEQFDLRKYDLILSSSSAFAKGVITNTHQTHICYCYTPMRYVWDLYHQYMKEDITNPIFRAVLPFVLHRIRMWDQLTAQRVDYFIADAHNVAKRIKKYYGRESEVIHPPVNIRRFKVVAETEPYYLIVSRLIPYKRVDIVIEAFNALKKPLIIIGDGYDRPRLQALAGPTVQLLGELPDEQVNEYFAKCQAFIMPGEEDFGITPLEAQACGRPVIAFRKGGSLETIVEGETGLFFDEQSADHVKKAILDFETKTFDRQQIRNHAELFSEERFKSQMMDFIRHRTH
ncbi:glycosyltransferase [Paenibacillus turpanensis]|uniref:glycosyltransferase n=1 Tax=Paenibacillus turpanensis TaxID=2689078 RepID=UPI0014092A13|nr:glycosyltransferase [Paenibacillus turpanensis]